MWYKFLGYVNIVLTVKQLMGRERSLYFFAYNWFPWRPTQTMISDEMESNGGLTNYKQL